MPLRRTLDCLGDYDLWISRLGSSGLDAANAAGLSQHLLETRNGRCAGGGRDRDSSDAADAGAFEVHRWNRPGLCGSSVPICFHYDRLWRGLGISLTDRERYHAEDD